MYCTYQDTRLVYPSEEYIGSTFNIFRFCYVLIRYSTLLCTEPLLCVTLPYDVYITTSPYIYSLYTHFPENRLNTEIQI